MRRALSWLLAAALAGCAPPAATVHVRAVEWNPAHADIGAVRAVAEAGEDVVAFTDGGAAVLSAGRLVAVDRSVPRWIAAGTLPAASVRGAWIVGVDGDGRLRRLVDKSRFEIVSDRFGLAGEYVLGVASLGGGVAGFRLSREIAVADGAQVVRYATGPLASLAGGGGRAALGGEGLRVFDAATRQVSAYAVPAGTGFVTVTASGKLFAATPDAVWSEDERGDLRLRFTAHGAIHGLAASGDRVWIADGAGLAVVEGDRAREASGAKISQAAQLVGSPSGDVWALANGTLSRFAVVNEGGARWDQAVAPAFARACARCHRTGGASGIDLSTSAAWDEHCEEIRRRVVVDRTMPPPGSAISEADREAIRAWLGR